MQTCLEFVKEANPHVSGMPGFYILAASVTPMSQHPILQLGDNIISWEKVSVQAGLGALHTKLNAKLESLMPGFLVNLSSPTLLGCSPSLRNLQFLPNPSICCSNPTLCYLACTENQIWRPCFVFSAGEQFQQSSAFYKMSLFLQCNN